MTDRSENNLTDIVEKVARQHYEEGTARIPGAPTWEEVPLLDKQQIKQALLPIIMMVLNLVDAEPHRPKRGDEVEAWLRKRREEERPTGEGWSALDDALDAYRLCSDTGALLSDDGAEPDFTAADLSGETYVTSNHESSFWHQYDAGVDPGRDGRYESDDDCLDLSTTRFWALHLHVTANTYQDALGALANVPIRATSGTLTGQYLAEHNFGDSFREWGEPAHDHDDHHLVVYFECDNIEGARATGNYLAGVALRAVGRTDDPNKHFAISTAGDFAEQIR